MRTLVLASALLWGLSLAPAASATVLFDWDVEELTRRADLVVVATVLSKQSFAADGTLMTTTRLRVERVLLGAAGAELAVLQLGGRLGPRVVDVPGDAELTPGQTYLLFTAQPPGQPYRSLVGMALGALRLDGNSLTQTVDVPVLNERGVLAPPPGTRVHDLEELERAVRRARR